MNSRREYAEQGLIFAGMMGMIDPARPEVKTAARRGQARPGLNSVMITGDYKDTATDCRGDWPVGDGGKVATGAELD